ncbi:hypothetical protein [Kitasatospora sp. HPMI-4]
MSSRACGTGTPHCAYAHWVGTVIPALWAAGAALLGLRRFRNAAY